MGVGFPRPSKKVTIKSKVIFTYSQMFSECFIHVGMHFASHLMISMTDVCMDGMIRI